MRPFLLAALVSSLSFAAPPAPRSAAGDQLAPLPPPSKTAAKAAVRRDMKQRTLRITDAKEVPDLHVAGGAATTLSFPIDVVPSRVLLVDVKNRFLPPQAAGSNLVIIPQSDLPAGEELSLQVGLADGSVLPFRITSLPTEVDLHVEVELALARKAAPDSVQGLKATITELQGKVDECLSSSADTGAGKIAALILKQDPSKPEAFAVERHQARHLDKQSRLLVETQHVYKLFDLSYVMLSVENRDPSRPWVMDHAEIAIAGGGSATDAKVLNVAQELNSIPPGETSKLVVGFATPLQTVGQRFTLRLVEKAGSRHVEMTDLSL